MKRLEILAGILQMIYIPLLIGLIWFDQWFMFKLMLTNTILIIGCFLFDDTFL